MISKWRVVAVRATGDRLIVEDEMSLRRARKLRDRLISQHCFAAVFLEPDQEVEVHLWNTDLQVPPRRMFRDMCHLVES